MDSLEENKPERKITLNEYELSIIKHHSYQELLAYIQKQIERDGDCEFADNWVNEFLNLDTKCDIDNFMKFFRNFKKS